MLSVGQLRTLMADPESDRVEKTTSTKNTDKFGEAICAFANDFPDHRRPGYLLVGVDDDGQASGLVATDELLRTLGDLRSNVNIEALPVMIVGKHTVDGGDVAVVEVMPSDWYDDRIEFQNPGGLYGMASRENFPRQTDYRNFTS